MSRSNNNRLEVAGDGCLARGLRAVKEEIGRRFREDGTRLSFKDIAQLAEDLAPGTQNWTGGVLFEQWFWENGKKVNWDLANHDMVHNNGKWTVETRRRLEKKELPRWAHQLINTINMISQKNSQQSFYHTLLADWKGLSGSGVILFSRMGAMLHDKRYQWRKRDQAETERALSQDVLKNLQPVIWVDNFTKMHGNPFYTLASGTYTESDFTAIALLHDERAVDMDYIYDYTGKPFPSVSRTMFKANMLQCIVDRFSKYNNFKNTSYYEDCMARTPEYVDFIVTPQHTYTFNNTYADSPNGLRNFRSYGMIPSNIGSQEGLAHCVVKLREMCAHIGERYQSIMVDPGIYWRFWKVCIYVYIEFAVHLRTYHTVHMYISHNSHNTYTLKLYFSFYSAQQT